MSRFLKNTLGFILFSVVFYVLFIFLWGYFAHPKLSQNLVYKLGFAGHMNTRLKEVQSFKNVDILFLGSSHTYRGFDPRIFSEKGLKTFNLGSSSQTPIQTMVLLERYLDSLQPKKIIYEVFPITFESDGVESSLDLIANSKTDHYTWEMVLKIHNLKTYNTYLYGLISNFFNINEDFVEQKVHEEDTYISGGFVQREMDYFKPIAFEKTELTLRENQLQAFEEVVNMIKSKNIELLLVFAPISKVYYNSIENISVFDDMMSSHSDYLNFNEIMNLNDSLHFYDEDHLNQAGVELFNRKLIEMMEEPGIKN